ncbi:MAG: metallophosphoesterase family protein [Candidatus Hodarchaeales archaeon]
MIHHILALADVHGNLKAVKALIDTISVNKLSFDLVLIAGDLPKTTPVAIMLQYMVTHPLKALSKSHYTKWVYKGSGRKKFVARQTKSVELVLQLLSKLSAPIIYVPGNVDTFEVIDYIKGVNSPDITVLEQSIVNYDNLSIIGHGGSMFTPKKYDSPLCDLEFPPKQFSEQAHKLLKAKIPEKNLKLLLTHEPPSFSLQTNKEELTGGSKTVSELIKNIRPEISLFGHWHELPLSKFNSGLNIRYLNPGPLACYNYATIDISNNVISIELKKLQPSKFDSTNIIYKYRNNPNEVTESIRFV